MDILETIISGSGLFDEYGIEISMYQNHYFYQPFSAFFFDDTHKTLQFTYKQSNYEIAVPDSYFGKENGIRIKELIDLPFKTIIFTEQERPINYEVRQSFVMSILFLYFKKDVDLINYFKKATYTFIKNGSQNTCILRPNSVEVYISGRSLYTNLFLTYLENECLVFKRIESYIDFEV